MRRSTSIAPIVLAAALLAVGGATLAGDFHNGTSLVCSDCHTMHYSQAHGFSPTGSSEPFVDLGAGGPFVYLLRADVNQLCLSCHDNQPYIPDVLEGNTHSTARQGGALNQNNTSPYYDSTGHTLGSSDVAPGGTWSSPDGLDCVDCHNPHGYGGGTADPYRNLSGSIAGFHPSVSYAVGVNDPAKDVFERVKAVYDVDNVDLNEPLETTGESAFGAWCGRCHDSFHGSVGSSQIGGTGSPAQSFDRHPTADVDIGAVGGGHSDLEIYRAGESGTKTTFVKVMSPSGVWPVNGMVAPASLPGDLTPTCITCHKGHGNRNAFGLIYMGETGTVTDEGSTSHTTGSPGTYIDLCKQCHVQGA